MSLEIRTTESPGWDSGLRRTIAVVLLGGIMGILDGSMVLVAVRAIAEDLDVSLGAVGWVSTAYLLAVTVTVPVGAWAVDRHGGKRLWLVGLGLFFAGSLGSALAPDLGTLIALRVLQGIGAGILDPLMLTLLARAAGPGRSGRVMGIMGIVGSAGPVAGPVAGGVLLQVLDWRWLFLVNIPIVVAAFGLAVRVLAPDTPAPESRGPRLDVVGVALIGPGVSAAVLGLSWIEREHTVLAGPVLVPLGLAAVLLGAYVWHALRRNSPLVDLRLLARPGLAASLLTAGRTGWQRSGRCSCSRSTTSRCTAWARPRQAPPRPARSRLDDRDAGVGPALRPHRRPPVAVAGGVVALAGAVLLAVQPARKGSRRPSWEPS